MGLESGTYISDLNVNNPTPTDAKSQGDDHLRLIKSTLLATFPNVTGAVTPTHTELNYVDGVTSAIQTQLDAITTLADGKIYIGNGSNVATEVTPTGDVTITNAGVTAISTGVIVNADINASAAIALSKLATGTADKLLGTDGSGVPSVVSSSYSLGTEGSITLPPALGSLILKWGRHNPSADLTWYAITFAVAFPNACLNVQLTGASTVNAAFGGAYIDPSSLSTSGFTYNANNYGVDANSYTYWFAIGY